MNWNLLIWDSQGIYSHGITGGLDEQIFKRGLIGALPTLYGEPTILPHESVVHLPAINSDHKPIIIFTNPKVVSIAKPFLFEGMSLRDLTIGAVISLTWQKGVEMPSLPQIMTKIKYTKTTLKDWNKKHFDIIQTRIGEIKHWIEYL